MSRFNPIFRLVLGFVAALAVSACASNPNLTASDTKDKESNLEERVVTGSRLKQKIDPDSEAPQTKQPVRVVDRDELDRTGSVFLDDALRKSVPQIGR